MHPTYAAAALPTNVEIKKRIIFKGTVEFLIKASDLMKTGKLNFLLVKSPESVEYLI